MFLVDLKDFRKLSDYPVPVCEQDVEAAMVEAGVVFDTPLALRLRIKDVDERFIYAKVEMIDPGGDEFRMNLYLPPAVFPMPEYLEDLNRSVRHLMVHIGQVRESRKHTGPPTKEEMVQLEKIAKDKSESGTCDILKSPVAQRSSHEQ